MKKPKEQKPKVEVEEHVTGSVFSFQLPDSFYESEIYKNNSGGTMTTEQCQRARENYRW